MTEWKKPEILGEIVRRWNALEKVADSAQALGFSELALARARAYANANGYTLLTNGERMQHRLANGECGFNGHNASGAASITMKSIRVTLPNGITATIRAQDKADAERLGRLLRNPVANVSTPPPAPRRVLSIAEVFALAPIRETVG